MSQRSVRARRSYIAPILLLGLCIFIAVMVVRVSLSGMLAGAPQLALTMLPGDPDAVFRDAMREYAQTKRVSDGSWKRIAAAVARKPLAAEPFVAAAVRTPPGARAQAIVLLEEAQRRNPRNRVARVMLMEHYARVGRPSEIVYELATLNRLIPNSGTVLIDALAAAVADPTVAETVFRSVRDPATLNALLAKLVRNGVPSATILQLAKNLPAGAAMLAAPWQTALLDRLIDQGRYGEARSLWREFSGIPMSATPPPLVNAGFERLQALPPFNWRLSSGDVGAAELTSRKALSVEYFGRQSGELAATLATFQPGRYRLRFSLEGHADANSSRLTWFVRCAEPGKPANGGLTLLSALLGNVGSSSRAFTAQFTVPPAGCLAQWLSLEGTSAEFPTSQSVEIRDLTVTRLG